MPVRKVHFLSFRQKGEILNANTINRIRFLAEFILSKANVLEMTVLPNFRTGTNYGIIFANHKEIECHEAHEEIRK